MISDRRIRQRQYATHIFMSAAPNPNGPPPLYDDNDRWNCRNRHRSVSYPMSRWRVQQQQRWIVSLQWLLLLLLLMWLVVLLSSPDRISNIHNGKYHVDAFRATSTSSSTTTTTSTFNITRQRQPMKKQNGIFRRNTKQTVLWQQQQQQQQQKEPNIVDKTTTTTDTTTTTVASKDGTVTELKMGTTGSNKSVVLLSALGLLTTCSIAAMTGVVPGYYQNDHTWPGSILLRDVGSTIVTGILGYAFVQCITYLTVTKQCIVSRDARKIIHTLSAPLFILFWPLYTSHHPSSRIFAAIVPILNGIRLFIASNSSANTINGSNESNSSLSSSESALAQAVSRSGDSKEALGGPFIYVCMLAMSILCFWTDTPHGIIAMSTLAAGDGMADLIGRRYGSTNPWPYNTKKSIVGSLAFVVASSITSVSLILWIQYTQSGLGTLASQYTTIEVAINVVLISIIAAIVETIPWLGDDNYTVPISAAIVSMILFS
jgi:phytol kinase